MLRSRHLARWFQLALLSVAAIAGAEDAAPPAAATSESAPMLSRDEKFKAPLTRIPNEKGRELPWSMRLDDPQFAALFPLAFSTDNSWWYTEGPDRFLVFKYPKTEPFEDRTGKFIKPPGSGNWAYLVAEDEFNFYFQWMPPGEMLSAEWKGNAKTRAQADARSDEMLMKKSDVDASATTPQLEQAKAYLGAPGHDVPKTTIEPAPVDVLDYRESSVGLPRAGLWQLRSALADFNGDGFLDVAAPPARKQTGGKPTIWLGDGGKRWTIWDKVKFPAGMPFDYGSAEAADFDGDGKMDLALAMHFKGAYIFYGDGKGDFTDYHKFFDGSSFTARSLAVGDFDGDKHPDLALFSELNLDPKTNATVIGRMVRVFLYRERNQYEPYDEGTSPHLIGDDIVVADVNADKRPDLVTSSHVWGHTSMVHLNRKEKGWKISREKLLANCYYWGVAAGDVDGDGFDDIVFGFAVIENQAGREQGGIAVFYNQKGKGLSEPQYVLLHDKPIPYFVVRLADLDNDGRTDIVASGAPDGAMRLLLQRKKGEFFLEDVQEMAPLIASGVRIADINKDGFKDLLVNYSSEEMGGAIKCWLGKKREP